MNEFDLKVKVGISAIVSLPVSVGIGISSIRSSLVIVGMKVMKYFDHFSGSSLATTYTGEFSKHYRFYGSLVSVGHQVCYGRHSKDCKWLKPATADKGFQYQHQPKLIS